MSEQENTQLRIEEQGNQTNDTNVDYLAAIKELKQNSVRRVEYDKVVEENRKLLKSIIDGQDFPTQETEKPKFDIQQLRNELFVENSQLNNLEYATKALQLRQAILENGGDDIFVGKGNKLVPSKEDYDAAERVADVLQDVVDYANGENSIFTDELQRRMVDAAPMLNRGKNRR